MTLLEMLEIELGVNSKDTNFHVYPWPSLENLNSLTVHTST